MDALGSWVRSVFLPSGHLSGPRKGCRGRPRSGRSWDREIFACPPGSLRWRADEAIPAEAGDGITTSPTTRRSPGFSSREATTFSGVGTGVAPRPGWRSSAPSPHAKTHGSECCLPVLAAARGRGKKRQPREVIRPATRPRAEPSAPLPLWQHERNSCREGGVHHGSRPMVALMPQACEEEGWNTTSG